MKLTYGPGKLSEYVGLKDEPGELLEPAHLVGDGLQVVLLQVQDTQPTYHTSNICSKALPPEVCTIGYRTAQSAFRRNDKLLKYDGNIQRNYRMFKKS
jgi:hypothetical protein